MSVKVKLTIQEIIEDFYSLGEKEGYLSGLAEGFVLEKKDYKEYHEFMKKLMDKYLPTWKEKVPKKYWSEEKTEDEKGLILSSELYKNFKHMFCEMIQ